MTATRRPARQRAAVGGAIHPRSGPPGGRAPPAAAASADHRALHVADRPRGNDRRQQRASRAVPEHGIRRGGRAGVHRPSRPRGGGLLPVRPRPAAGAVLPGVLTYLRLLQTAVEDWFYALSHTASMVAVVTSIIGGVFVALAVDALAAGALRVATATTVGVAVTMAGITALAWHQSRRWRAAEDNVPTLFPSGPARSAPRTSDGRQSPSPEDYPEDSRAEA